MNYKSRLGTTQIAGSAIPKYSMPGPKMLTSVSTDLYGIEGFIFRVRPIADLIG